MAVWIHRISHCAEDSYRFLAKGYLSIGFSDIAKERDFVSAMKDASLIGKGQRDFLEKKIIALWGEKIKQRYGLWRFLLEFKIGDIVVIPLFDQKFTIVKVIGQWLTLEQYQKEFVSNRAEKTVIKKEESIDIGFLLPIKFLFEGEKDENGIISAFREEYADDALCSCMKIPKTNMDISYLQKSVEYALENQKQKNTIYTLSQIQTTLTKMFLKIMQDFFETDHIDKLIKCYLQKQGAIFVQILPKREKQYTDIVAEFQQLGLILCVKVAHDISEIDKWVMEQIQIHQKQLYQQSDGSIYGMWIISIKNTYSNAAKECAAKNNVQLIEGNVFAKMLLKAGLIILDEI